LLLCSGIIPSSSVCSRGAHEIERCRRWLDRERAIVAPELVLALGATAARSLFGRPVVISKMRGTVVEREDGSRLMVTTHPSYLLRIEDARTKAAEYRHFVADLKVCAQALAKAA
jgi:uracil-DNA glycosylase family 4